MLSKLRRFRIAIIILLLAILALTASLAFDLLNSTTSVIDTTVAGSSIYIESNQDTVLFPQDCITISWDLQAINSVFVNGLGRAGVNTETFCARQVLFVVNHQDETTSEFVVSPKILIRDSLFQWRIIAIFVSFTAIFGLLGLLGNPKIWWQDTKLFFKEIMIFWRQFNTYSRRYRWLVVLVFTVGAMLRLFYATQDIFIDEAISFNKYSWSFTQAISTYDDPNNHLLNSFMMYGLRSIFGDSLLSIRLHVILSGIAILPLVYTLAHAIYNRYVALIAMGIVAISHNLIYYSATARGYILQTLFFLIMLILLQIIIKRNNYFAWLCFVISTVLSFFTLPTTVFIYASIGIWLLLTYSKQDNWLQHTMIFVSMTVIGAFFTILSYMPTITRLGIAPILSNSYVENLSGLDGLFVSLSRSIPVAIMSWFAHLPIPLVWVILIAGALGLIVNHRVKSKQQYPLFLTHVIVIAIMLIVVLQMNPFPRVWTFFAPLFILQCVVGLYWIYKQLPETASKFGSYLFVVIFLLSAGFYTANVYSIVSSHSYENAYLHFRDDLMQSDNVQVISYYPMTDFLRYYLVRDDISLNRLGGNLANDNVTADTLYLISIEEQTPEYIISSRNDIMLDNIDWVVTYQTNEISVYQSNDVQTE